MEALTERKPTLTRRERWDLRWGQLETEFSAWKPHYQELSNFLMPRNGRFFVQDRNRGGKRHNTIYDNTGTHALRTTGSGLMAGATSPARPWFRVVTRDTEINRSFTVRRWLDDVTKIILRVCAKSNVYRVLHMMYEELAAFGTAACIVMPDFDNVVHLHPLTCGEYRLATNYKGVVDTCYRTFEMTVAQAVEEFGFEACSHQVQQAWNDCFYENKVVVRHVIEPRRQRDATKVDNLNMPWMSAYYEVGQREDKVLRESGFERFPVLAPRWSAIGGDVYGHSPGMEALGDVKQLQHEQLRKAQGIDFQTLPPMLAPSDAKGMEHKWVPGGVVYTSAAGAQSGLRTAFETKLDLQHLLADIQDVRDRIRAAFFADLFLMISMQPSNARMTATEVAERHEEKLIQLGPVLERLHTELLAPLVQAIYRELLDAGALPQAPPEMVDLDLSLEFISMLAQAQRAVGVTGIERMLMVLAPVAEAKPDMLDNLSEDDLWAELSDMIGVSPRISNSPEVRDKLRRARLASQGAAAQLAAQEQASKAVANVGSVAAASPNALSDVMSMFSGYDQPAAKAY